MENKTNLENVHWADNSAQRVIDTFPNEKVYTVASGITPSGIIHFGHFREIITSEFVRKSLEKKGKKTKFIYSWDSYDAFRKVPKNIPNPEEYAKNLRLPDAKMPDPWGCHESFAEHFMQDAEKTLEVFNFPIEYQRQHLIQTSGEYANGIKDYLNGINVSREVINKFRDEDRQLGSDWMPLTVYAQDTGKDTTKVLSYDGKYTIEYENIETGYKNTINFKETPIVKLAWRLDWPMRWAHFGVTFEPGGKDHSTPGGSYDTGCDIVRKISNREPPVYTFYNFIGMKGQGGKISSSSGNGVTIGDTVKVYSPEMILYLFASTRPNAEFDISFDADVIKIYEDFDKLERLYFGLEEEKNEKKLATLKRVYELSIVNGVEIQKELPIQPSLRHLSVIAQANNFDFEKVTQSYQQEIKTDFDKNRLKERFDCVKNWLENHAPEEFVFSMNTTLKVRTKEEDIMVKKVAEKLLVVTNPKELMPIFKQISQEYKLSVQDFFTFMYRVLISKEKGPRLGGFLIDNKEFFINLLTQKAEINN
jgi:lysyl-tRNA synthetase class 1